MWHFLPDLKSKGIMGINRRNREYIFKNNPRRNYALVDDKLETKKLALAHNIGTPELYGEIHYQQQIRHFDKLIQGRDTFVIKPARGSGGGGIVVVREVGPMGYVMSNGRVMTKADMDFHLSNILSGLYSLSGLRDKVIVEQCIELSPIFKNLSYKGIPDIRVVVYKGVPVMAMLRLPTVSSSGKANLHMGGIGVGIDMCTGQTLNKGVRYNNFIDRHVDTGAKFGALNIPDWLQCLRLAAKCGDIVGMGYIGVDLILDQTLGAMMLEVNARPGISIQVANRAGLLPRLELVDELKAYQLSLEERLQFAAQHFAAADPTETP